MSAFEIRIHNNGKIKSTSVSLRVFKGGVNIDSIPCSGLGFNVTEALKDYKKNNSNELANDVALSNFLSTVDGNTFVTQSCCSLKDVGVADTISNIDADIADAEENDCWY